MTPRRERLAEALVCVLPYREEVDGTPAEHVAAWARRLRDGGRVLARGVEWEFGGAPEVTPWAITDPREAWEVITTRLDLAGAVENPRREFASPVVFVSLVVRVRELDEDANTITFAAEDELGNRELRNRCAPTWDGNEPREPIPIAHPPTVADCVAFAADWPGVLTAEAIARELTGRDRVVWRVLPAPQVSALVRASPPTGTHDALGWQEIAALGWRRTPSERQRVVLDRARDLLATGYALDAVTDDHVVLVAPGLGT